MPVDAQKATEQWMRYQYCRDRGHLQFIEKADTCEKFFAGEQWSPVDLNTLKLQRRPALTVNKIISTLSTVFGEQIYNRSETLFRPAAGAPNETAEALTKVFMQISQNNQLPWVRSDLFADGAIRSRGFVDIRMDFTDSLRGEVRITNLNSKNVVVDPDAEEYDPDSWNDIFITKWITPQDVAILYNEEDAEYLKTRDTSAYPYGYDSIERTRDRFGGNQLLAGYYGILDPQFVRRNIRILDRQYHMLDKMLHFVDVETGDMRQVPADWDRNRIAALLEKAGGTISTMKKLVKRVRWTVTADQVVLHDDWSPYKHFTVVPYFPHFRYGRTIGLVENLIGPQELLNKTLSQELHVINTSANSGWKVKKGALANMSVEELEQTGAATGLVLELDDINNADKISPNQVPTGLDRVSYKAEEHIKTISGVSDSMQGFDREDVAAKAISTKRQQGSQNQMKVMDNLERTDYLIARNTLDLVQQYYTEPRIINITHDDVTREVTTVSVNEVTPEGIINNDLTIGEYSIVITSQPYRASLEDSQFEQAVNLREIGIPIPDDVLIESSRLLRKADIVKKMAGDQESPEAQRKAQRQERLEEATAATAEADVMSKQADAKLKAAKADAEIARVQIEGQRAANEPDPMVQMQADLAKVQQELELMREKFALEAQAKQQDMALKQQDAELDRQIKQDNAAQDAVLKQQQAELNMQQQAKQGEKEQEPESF